MKLQTALNGKDYQAKAKKYVINMKGNRKKLHIKNGCYWSRFFEEFYSFDNLADAKNCGVETTVCEKCFKKRIINL